MDVQTLRTISPPPGAQRHLASLGFVAAIHAVLFAGLWNLGVIDYVIEKAKDPITVVDLPPITSPPPPPTVPVEPTAQATPLPTVPEPIFDVADDAAGRAGNPITVALGTPAPAAPDTAARVIERTRTIPPYPAIERRLGREGVVTVRLTIADTGFVSDVTLLKSSGHKGLDDAALAWIKKHWRYKPALRNGMAVASSTTAQMKFELH
jgi:protein TonB